MTLLWLNREKYLVYDLRLCELFVLVRYDAVPLIMSGQDYSDHSALES